MDGSVDSARFIAQRMEEVGYFRVRNETAQLLGDVLDLEVDEDDHTGMSIYLYMCICVFMCICAVAEPLGDVLDLEVDEDDHPGMCIYLYMCVSVYLCCSGAAGRRP